MKRKNKNFKKKKFKFIKQVKFISKKQMEDFQKCPLSIKNAPIIDYKNISLLRKYMSDNGKIISSKITSVSFKTKKAHKRDKKAKILGLCNIMELILLENILNLGNIGDKVKVKMVMEKFSSKSW